MQRIKDYICIFVNKYQEKTKTNNESYLQVLYAKPGIAHSSRITMDVGTVVYFKFYHGH